MGIVLTTVEQELSAKKTFARELVRGVAPYEAICRAIRDESVDRVRLMIDWQRDEKVLEFRRELEDDESDEVHGLVSKAQFCRDLYAKFLEADPGDAAKLAKVYADVRGFTKKPTEVHTTTNTTNQTVQVLKVVDHGSDADWERKAVGYQKELIAKGHELAGN